jgi:uncharacterized protein
MVILLTNIFSFLSVLLYQLRKIKSRVLKKNRFYGILNSGVKITMRFYKQEKEALKYAFKDFKGEVYVFGSRSDDTKKGGDIDILVIPQKNTNSLKMSIEIQKRFFPRCEQKLDVIVYRQDNPFYREVLNNAKRLDIQSI